MAASTQTGTYTGPVDLLTQFRSFIMANGWSENEWSTEGSGQRLHIEKTVDSSTFYLNFRALVNESVSGASTTYYGIACNGSTGYDTLEGSLEQPGSPTDQIASDPVSGISYSSSTSQSYRFVVDTDFFSITSFDASGNIQHIISTSHPSMYGIFCTATINRPTVYYSDRGTFLKVSTPSGTALEHLWGNHLMTASGWYKLRNEFGSAISDVLKGVFDAGNVEAGVVVESLLNNSPSPVLGIPVLFPFVLCTRESSSTGYRQWDGVTGIKFLNNKYINDGDTITVGGVDYVVYNANYNLQDYGIAFKVS